jgi:hypothetical protein
MAMVVPRRGTGGGGAVLPVTMTAVSWGGNRMKQGKNHIGKPISRHLTRVLFWSSSPPISVLSWCSRRAVLITCCERKSRDRDQMNLCFVYSFLLYMRGWGGSVEDATVPQRVCLATRQRSSCQHGGCRHENCSSEHIHICIVTYSNPRVKWWASLQWPSLLGKSDQQQWVLYY